MRSFHYINVDAGEIAHEMETMPNFEAEEIIFSEEVFSEE